MIREYRGHLAGTHQEFELEFEPKEEYGRGSWEGEEGG